jgi:hypothetical protein
MDFPFLQFWRSSVGRWTEKPGQNDKNGPLADDCIFDELEIFSKMVIWQTIAGKEAENLLNSNEIHHFIRWEGREVI